MILYSDNFKTKIIYNMNSPQHQDAFCLDLRSQDFDFLNILLQFEASIVILLLI